MKSELSDFRSSIFASTHQYKSSQIGAPPTPLTTTTTTKILNKTQTGTHSRHIKWMARIGFYDILVNGVYNGFVRNLSIEFTRPSLRRVSSHRHHLYGSILCSHITNTCTGTHFLCHSLKWKCYTYIALVWHCQILIMRKKTPTSTIDYSSPIHKLIFVHFFSLVWFCLWPLYAFHL